GHVETAAEVGVDHLLPLLAVHPLHRRVASDPGIVDQHVDRTELAFNLTHAVLTRVEIGDVPFECLDSGAVREGACALVVTRIVGSYFHAHVTKGDADRFADSTRAAGDDRNPCHCGAPFWFGARLFRGKPACKLT